MIKISGGTIYDPINGIDGEIGEVWINDGRIVAAPAIPPENLQTIDARGLVVMPGGVDIHSHISGSKANAGRKLCPEDGKRLVRPKTSITRSGTGLPVPSTHLTGYLYAEMGYTTVMEAAAAPLMARHTHEELEDTPVIDRAVFVTMGNNHFIMQCIKDGQPEKARDYVAWLLEACKGYAIKIVNPGGVENWKYGKNVNSLDDAVIGFGVTPREIIKTLAWVSEDLDLPHPIHLHGVNLGLPGNAAVTAETMTMLEGREAHFCHVQFMGYAGEPGGLPRSGAQLISRTVNHNSNITVDVGQIAFGPATTMTSDGPVQFSLSRKVNAKWINDDLESESGGGVVPLAYKRNNPVHGTMWINGMETFLLVDDPWRITLTTDHPNGGPFLNYPLVIRQLMDRDFRMQQFESLHKLARKKSILPELQREYSLYEIAIITRAGPARRLGLSQKGHLGPGADGDVTIYRPRDNKEKMFAQPEWVFKGGEAVVERGEIVHASQGRTMYVSPEYDDAICKHIRRHFKERYTVAYENFAIEPEHIGPNLKIACGKAQAGSNA